MSRRIKVLISVLGVILLMVMSTATMAMAQEEEELESVPPAEGWGLMARVAEILDISQDDLGNAFEQAREEMREECEATGDCTILRERVMFGDQNMRFRISQSVRGRHMIAGPRGWQQPGPPELAE
ncbi:hypothetical protein ACFLVK_01055 [Chloroflexota bacterium]